MAVNPVGYVPINDFGTPRIITTVAREAISGGQFVFCSGASDAVSSGAASYVTADLQTALAASGQNFLGLALHNSGSNDYLSVAVDVVALVRCDGTVTENFTQVTRGAHAVLDGTTAGHVIGRSYTIGTSGNYALVHLSDV